MTKTEIQPEDKAPTFAKGQKIWVEAAIADDKPSPNGKILIEIQSDNTFSKTSLIRAYPERIKTTKQICDEQNTRLAPQNAEHCKGDECWVRAKFLETDNEITYVKIVEEHETELSVVAFVPNEDVRFTEPTHSTAIIEFVEPDRTRMFRKGDKVQRRKELYGRPLNKWADEIPFDVIYEVLEDEDPLNNHNVKIEHNGETFFVNFVYFDLVEPAPEPEQRFKINEGTGCYYINDSEKYYSGIYSKQCYSLEEVQAECARLNQKEQLKQKESHEE